MALDVRSAQTTIENALRDAILYALGIRRPSVVDVSELRAVPTMGQSSTMRSDDDLIQTVVAGVATASYRWSSVSTAADNGTTVIKPDDVPANGRWLQWKSPVRLAPTIGGNSFYLHEILSGPLARVILLDRALDEEEINALFQGQIPAVVITATDDDPNDEAFLSGHRWWVDYGFTISVIAQNLRDRREAAQGSLVPNDSIYGANTIDALIWSMLSGSALFFPRSDIGLGAALDTTGVVQPKRAENDLSHMGQRRVERARRYVVRVNVENPSAPNDANAAGMQEVDYQALLTDLKDQESFDPSNYIASGCGMLVDGVGFTKTIAAGSVILAGLTVAYAGEVRVFSAVADTYRDLLPNGTMLFITVTSESPAPAVTATALRIGMTRTDSTGVVFDKLIASTQAPYGAVQIHPLT